MRALGASENKIHEIRDADRKAQRVTELIEVDLIDIQNNRALFRSFLQAPDVAYITDG